MIAYELIMKMSIRGLDLTAWLRSIMQAITETSEISFELPCPLSTSISHIAFS